MRPLDLRLTAGFAIFALIISILSAGISGHSIGVVILRSIFSAVIFGGIGAGIGFLIQTYLPELYQLSSLDESSEEEEESSEGQGENVDILLDDENEGYEPENKNMAGATQDNNPKEGAEDFHIQGADSFVEEVAEAPEETETKGAGEKQSSQAQANEHENNLSFLQEDDKNTEKSAGHDESGTGEENEKSKKTNDEGSAGLNEDVTESLPDLDTFSDSFAGPITEDSSEEGSSSDVSGQNSDGGYGSGKETVNVNGEEQDPAILAKAVKSMMSKE